MGVGKKRVGCRAKPIKERRLFTHCLRLERDVINDVTSRCCLVCSLSDTALLFSRLSMLNVRGCALTLSFNRMAE